MFYVSLFLLLLHFLGYPFVARFASQFVEEGEDVATFFAFFSVFQVVSVTILNEGEVGFFSFLLYISLWAVVFFNKGE